jgi:hypothetical protein
MHFLAKKKNILKNNFYHILKQTLIKTIFRHVIETN